MGSGEVPAPELEGREVDWGGDGGGGGEEPGQPAGVGVPGAVPGQEDSPGRPEQQYLIPGAGTVLPTCQPGAA